MRAAVRLYSLALPGAAWPHLHEIALKPCSRARLTTTLWLMTCRAPGSASGSRPDPHTSIDQTCTPSRSSCGCRAASGKRGDRKNT